MAINKPDSSINFRFGTLSGYKGLASEKISKEDLYFVYTPDSEIDASMVYGTIFVNGIMFGSKVFDLSINEGELHKTDAGAVIDGSYVTYPSMTFKKLNAAGNALEDVSMAYISVNNFKTINEVVQVVEKKIETIEKLPDDVNLLKNINVNGVEGDVSNNIASVTIKATDIAVGADSSTSKYFTKDTSIAAALETIAKNVSDVVSKAGVTSIGEKTGAITLKGDNTEGVNLSISDSGEISASLVGLDASTEAVADTYVTAIKQMGGKITAVSTEALSKGKISFRVNGFGADGQDAASFEENAKNKLAVNLQSANTAVLTISAATDAAHSTAEDTSVNITITPVLDENGPSKDSAALVTSGKVYTAIEEAKKTLGVKIKKLDTAETGYVASYQLVNSSTGTVIGDTINIPKDYLVKSATLGTATEDDKPQEGIKKGDKYIDFVINTVGGDGNVSHIYLNVADLVDAYSGGDGISVSDANVISLKVKEENGLSVDATDGLKLAVATSTTAGAMSAEDKKTLDDIAKNGVKSVVVNGSTATVSNNTATVTITSDNMKVGGNSAIKDSSVSTVVVDISTRLDTVEQLLLWKGLS